MLSGSVQYKLLDTYCCAGGASYGYWKSGFGVVGVDIRKQKRYPFEFIQADVLEILRDSLFLDGFSVIHASPPCQLHTQLGKLMAAQGVRHWDRDYIAETRELLDEWALRTGGLWVMENVPQAPLLDSHSVTLCGTQFGLGLWGRDLIRHRLFESNIKIPRPGRCRHSGKSWGVYGSLNSSIAGGSETPPTLDAARRLMGIDWMLWRELREALPPVYTEYIGGHLRTSLESVSACQAALRPARFTSTTTPSQ